MAAIHMSEGEVSRDLHDLLARFRAGAEIVIDDASPAIRVALVRSGRIRLPESIALAVAHAEECGSEPEMDEDFAADLEQIIANRRPRDTSTWD